MDLYEIHSNPDKFYHSKEWEEAAAKARELQHNECQRCRAAGRYRPCEAVHHKKYIKIYPELALDQGNLECLCYECHELEHGRMKEGRFENQERW